MVKRVLYMITILSIDGGGIRGLIPAAVLAEIEKKTGKSTCELFDYIAGTSTGGIIASMLTVPNAQGKPKYTAEQVKALYIELGFSVFQNSLLRKIFIMNGLLKPRYSAKRLEQYLNGCLGKARLHSALTDIIIPAYEMQSGTPWFFKSRFAADHRSSEDDPLLSQVARATSAAPTYFPPCKIGNKLCLIDGGVFANNPALCAYAEARKLNPSEKNYLIVSLGTGQHQKSYPYREIENWGTLKWAIPIFSVLSNSASGTVDYQMKTLTGAEQYYRFEVLLHNVSTEIDDASKSNIQDLEMIARMEIQHNADKINRICRLLLMK